MAAAAKRETPPAHRKCVGGVVFYKHRLERNSASIAVTRRRLAELFLHLADALLNLALGLLATVAARRADDVIDLSLHLLGLTGHRVFASHWDLLLGWRNWRSREQRVGQRANLRIED